MKVRAKLPPGKFGFYGSKRRYDGDEFTLEGGKNFSESWMIKIEDDEKPRRPGRPKKVETLEEVSGAE